MKERIVVSNDELKRQDEIASEILARIGSLHRTYFVETFGCQMNVRDSETVKGWFSRMGMTQSDRKEQADLILYNTCCIRDHAEKRLMGNIGALKEWKEADPTRILCICGCMMQQDGVARKMLHRFSHVDLTFGPHVLHRLPEMLQRVLNGERVCVTDEDGFPVCEGMTSVRDNTRSAFVNITFGCDNFCSYCIVPYVRGRERSRLMEDIAAEVVSLCNSGITEITLLGQNVNSYGKDLEDASFAKLLYRLNGIEGLKRLRFMTSHPKDLNDDVIDAIANNDRVCHHVHLPVQSGDDAILKRMNRKYTREQYLSIVRKLRQKVKDIEFTTDIIVGFPGETEEQFLNTLSLVEEVGYAAAFTFAYSPRKGTVAAGMEEQIPEPIKKERLLRLNALQANKTVQNNEKYLGHVGEVLVEGSDSRGGKTILFGKYANFKMVYFEGDLSLLDQYVTVRVTKTNKNSLMGELIHA